MKLGRTFLVAAVALGLSAGVEAKTTDLGSLGNGATPFFGDTLDPGSGSFMDTVTMNLSAASDLVGGLFASGISDFKISLDGGAPNSGVTAGAYTFGTYSFSDLSPGSHTFTITGTASAAAGGAYLSAFEVTAAVPEAETWLMVIVGMGLVGYQLRRKQKALVRHPLLQA